jgi:hypothetical protein
MKLFTSFFLMFHLNFSAASWAQKKDYLVAAVAFYNLEIFFNPEDNPLTKDEDFTPEGSHRYTDAVFAQKAKNMAEVLAQLGTDYNDDGAALIGICEVEDDKAIKTLLSQTVLKQRKYRFVRFDGPDKRGINVALIYSPKYFKVISARPLHVNLDYVGGGDTRDVLLVEGVLQGDTIFVLVNHWPSRSGGEAASAPKRAAAAEVNKLAVAQILNKDPMAKIIIMGDLNDDPVDPSVAKVLGAIGHKKNAMSKDLLYNPWTVLFEKGIGTLSHNDKWNLFDQIIISPSWLINTTGHWQYYQARVFDKDFLKNSFGKYRGYPHRSYSGNKWINGYSDHFPTVIYFIKDAPQQSLD